jgi:DNA segregation ATPase FtsK/SpoIIIE, S-DNA-T family
MTRRPAASRNQKNRPSQPGIETKNNPEEGAISRLSGWFIHFDRFGWDILGIVVLVIALLTLIGLLGWTKGAIITPWTSLITRWMGWGRYLVVIGLALLGLLAVRWRSERILKFNLGKTLALEAGTFTLLALLSLNGGQSLTRAEAGEDGGLIGWGLSSLLSTFIPTPISTILLVVITAFFLILGLGIAGFSIRIFERWLFAEGVSEKNPDAAQGVDPSLNSITKPGEKPDNSLRAPGRKQGAIKSSKLEPRDDRLPPLNLLTPEEITHPDESQIHETAQLIEKTLAEFGVPSRVVGFRTGPTVTQFAVEPGFVEKIGSDGIPLQQKVRVAQISNLARDLALALSAERLRIEAPVPGQSFVGIEVPNSHSTLVRLRSLLESEQFQKLASPLSLVLGKDVSGQPVVADLGRMPHILIAGTTGSGKSVCITAITACLMMNNTPEELRLVMLDPKMVELVRFNGLPHLLGKVETEIERMLGVLRWAMVEMDRRYRLLESVRARDLEAYNQKMERKNQPGLPRIVILVDELADLMMTAPDQTEHSLVRLAQMARATGIHMVVATQRPSVDVVTGLIKANFPARISFTVASSVDSRVILDTNGAEALLGRGDMLFLNPESGTPLRAQGVMVTDQEIERAIEFWKKMAPAETSEAAPWEELVTTENDSDDLIQQAVKIVTRTQRASASLLQRRLHIGYPRAARLLDELETLGIVGPAQGGGRERDVLIAPEEGDKMDNEDGSLE